LLATRGARKLRNALEPLHGTPSSTVMMRHAFRRSWSVAIALLAAACDTGDPSGTRADLVTADSAGLRITTIERAPQSLPVWQLTTAPDRVLSSTASGDTTGLSAVGPVRWLDDGGVLVTDLDQMRLLLFDSTGAFRRALGRKGAGPGELRYIASVSVDRGDTVTTFDGALRRLSVWHPDSGFVRLVSLGDAGALEAWPEAAWRWQDSLIVVLQLAVTPRPAPPPEGAVRRWPMRAALTVRDRDGRVRTTTPSFDGMYTGLFSNGDTRLPFSNQPWVTVTDDRVYFGSGVDFRLAYLASTSAPAGEVRWPAQHEALTRAEVDTLRDEIAAAAFSNMPLAEARAALAMNFAPEILPENRPAIGRVFVDDAARLWVERFEPGQLGPRLPRPSDRWTVLASDGRPIARVLLPPGTRLEDVHGDRAVVVQRDSLDVPYIRVYPVVRPTGSPSRP
jgi:hypothetical protein